MKFYCVVSYPKTGSPIWGGPTSSFKQAMDVLTLTLNMWSDLVQVVVGIVEIEDDNETLVLLNARDEEGFERIPKLMEEITA